MRDPIRNTPIPWSLKLIWCLESGLASDGKTLWCGTMPGGLFQSTDAGESWQLIRSLWDHPARKNWFGGGADLPGIHSVVVDPRNPDRMTIAVSCGGVWQSQDGGKNWDLRATGIWANYMPPERRDDPSIQDPHILRICQANPALMWVQHHNGVFRSLDNAQTWSEVTGIQPSNFGFTVAVHPQDGNTAWLIPATTDEKRYPVDGKLVVLRTCDGGQSFTSLSTGLPQEHTYDLIYRHALAIDPSGTTLAFGSTTGNLWLSEDQGDHWQTISSHLPPIYCLRFVANH